MSDTNKKEEKLKKFIYECIGDDWVGDYYCWNCGTDIVQNGMERTDEGYSECLECGKTNIEHKWVNKQEAADTLIKNLLSQKDQEHKKKMRHIITKSFTVGLLNGQMNKGENGNLQSIQDLFKQFNCEE